MSVKVKFVNKNKNSQDPSCFGSLFNPLWNTCISLKGYKNHILKEKKKTVKYIVLIQLSPYKRKTQQSRGQRLPWSQKEPAHNFEEMRTHG